MIRWARPEMLWWLVPWAAATWAAARILRARERRLADLIEPALWPAMLPWRDPRRPRCRLGLRSVALGLVVLALARPQWGVRPEEVRRLGMQIAIVLDTSNSMLATDLKPSRLQQAKWGIRDFLLRLRGDRAALVAFAGTAFVQCPMTSDHAALLMTLDDIRPGIIPRGGTAIGEAIRVAAEAFDYGVGGARAIVLVTDGEDHEADPLSTIPLLRERGVRVYAIGIGTPEGELIPLSDGGFLKDREGRVVKTRLREEPLARLAAETGGAYVRATLGDLGFDRIYEDGIAQLDREEQESRRGVFREERAGLLLGAALVVLAIEAVFGGLPARRAQAAMALVALAVTAPPGFATPAREAMAEGLRHLEAGRPADAAGAFERAALAAPTERLDPARARYNRALSLLQGEGREPDAMLELEQALQTADPETQRRALFARGWSLARAAADARALGQLPQARTNALRAASAFEDVLTLHPEDDDARWNYEVARRLAEEIERQLQQSQPSPEGGDPQPHPPGEAPQPPPSPDNASPANAPPPAGQEEPQPQPPPPAGNEPTPSEAGQADRNERDPERMTPEEAAMLLDSLRAEEAAIRHRLHQRRGPQLPVEKDW